MSGQAHKETIVSGWEYLKVLIETSELDLAKYVRGNIAAGVRTRRSMRSIKKQVSILIKELVTEMRELEQARIEAKSVQ